MQKPAIWAAMCWRMRHDNRWHKLHLPQARRPHRYTCVYYARWKCPKCRTHIERVVRIRRNVKQYRYTILSSPYQPFRKRLNQHKPTEHNEHKVQKTRKNTKKDAISHSKERKDVN